MVIVIVVVAVVEIMLVSASCVFFFRTGRPNLVSFRWLKSCPALKVLVRNMGDTALPLPSAPLSVGVGLLSSMTPFHSKLVFLSGVFFELQFVAVLPIFFCRVTLILRSKEDTAHVILIVPPPACRNRFPPACPINHAPHPPRRMSPLRLPCWAGSQPLPSQPSSSATYA